MTEKDSRDLKVRTEDVGSFLMLNKAGRRSVGGRGGAAVQRKTQKLSIRNAAFVSLIS